MTAETRRCSIKTGKSGTTYYWECSTHEQYEGGYHFQSQARCYADDHEGRFNPWRFEMRLEVAPPGKGWQNGGLIDKAVLGRSFLGGAVEKAGAAARWARTRSDGARPPVGSQVRVTYIRIDFDGREEKLAVSPVYTVA